MDHHKRFEERRFSEPSAKSINHPALYISTGHNNNNNMGMMASRTLENEISPSHISPFKFKDQISNNSPIITYSFHGNPFYHPQRPHPPFFNHDPYSPKIHNPDPYSYPQSYPNPSHNPYLLYNNINNNNNSDSDIYFNPQKSNYNNYLCYGNPYPGPMYNHPNAIINTPGGSSSIKGSSSGNSTSSTGSSFMASVCNYDKDFYYNEKPGNNIEKDRPCHLVKVPSPTRPKNTAIDIIQQQSKRQSSNNLNYNTTPKNHSFNGGYKSAFHQITPPTAMDTLAEVSAREYQGSNKWPSKSNNGISAKMSKLSEPNSTPTHNAYPPNCHPIVASALSNTINSLTSNAPLYNHDDISAASDTNSSNFSESRKVGTDTSDEFWDEWRTLVSRDLSEAQSLQYATFTTGPSRTNDTQIPRIVKYRKNLLSQVPPSSRGKINKAQIHAKITATETKNNIPNEPPVNVVTVDSAAHNARQNGNFTLLPNLPGMRRPSLPDLSARRERIKQTIASNNGQPIRHCSHCFSTETSVWRRSPLNPSEFWCNPCKTYYNYHGGRARPMNLVNISDNNPIKKRKRN